MQEDASRRRPAATSNIDYSPSPSKMSLAIAVAENTIPEKFTTSPLNSTSGRLSKRLTKTRAGSLPLADPYQLMRSSIRFSRSTTDLSTAIGVKADATEDVQDAQAESMEAVVPATTTNNTRVDGADPFVYQSFATLNEGYGVTNEETERNDKRSLHFTLAISDHQTLANGNNNMNIYQNSMDNKFNVEQPHEQYFREQCFQNGETFPPTSAHTSWLNSPSKLNKNTRQVLE